MRFALATTALLNGIATVINNIATPHRIRFISITTIALAATLVVLIFTTSADRQTPFGPQLGADYANFYIAGTILNSTSPELLYDLSLQSQLYHELLPRAPSHTILPYPYAPYFAVLFQPFALLPYEWSYCVWIVCNLLAYAIGFILLWKANADLGTEKLYGALLIACSFLPFIMEGWIGGQSVGVILLLIGLAIFCHSRSYDVLSGFTLSLCLFKPTLLVLLVPMIVFGRSYGIFTGFIIGSVTTVGLSWLAVGQRGLLDYAHLLVHYGKLKSMAPEAFRTFKYVDLTSFMRLITPHQTLLSSLATIIITVVVASLLIYCWSKSDHRWSALDKLSWATALAWTPVLSPQCAIYDITLLVPSFVLMFSAQTCLPHVDASHPQDTLRALAVLLYVTSGFTQLVALSIGFQIVTVVIIAIGVYAIRLAYLLQHINPTTQQGVPL